MNSKKALPVLVKYNFFVVGVYPSEETFFLMKGVEGKTVGPLCPSLTDKILKEDK